MKKLIEIPECRELIDIMLEKMDKVSIKQGYDANYKARKKVEEEYLPLIDEIYKKYKKEHPEEFEEK